MNVVIRKTLLILAMLAAAAGFVLCIVVAVSRFIPLTETDFLRRLLVFAFLPLCCSALRLLDRRTKGRWKEGWMAALFSVLPQWSTTAFRWYFRLIVVAGSTLAVVDAFRGQQDWGRVLAVLVLSTGYLACLGAYWSAIRELTNRDGTSVIGSQEGMAGG